MDELNLNLPDLRKDVKTALPILFEFVPETDRAWGIANKLYRVEVEKNYRKAANSIIEVEATLHDIIRKALKGDAQAARMLDFFKKLLEELTMYCSVEDGNKIRKTIREMLINMNHRYLNFFGEIAVLNNLMKTGDYYLDQVEARLLDSPKTIDFAIRKKESGKTLLVEVVNIHPDSDRIENIPGKLSTYLTGKIIQKRESKATATEFYLIPVIWAPYNDLKIYSDFLREHTLPIPGLIEPAAYSTFVSKNDGAVFIHRFGRLTTLFSDEFGGEYSTDYE